MLFAAGALTLGFTACEEDGQDLNFNIQPGNELYAPAEQRSVNLDQVLDTSFEWAPSVAEDGGYITYEVLFDKADGDFSAPLPQDQPDDRLQSFAEHLGQRAERSGRPGGHRECQDRANQMDGTCRQGFVRPDLHTGQRAHRYTYQPGRPAADGRHAEGRSRGNPRRSQHGRLPPF